MTNTNTSTRKPALDLLRGFIMIIMALDHANVFMGPSHTTEAWGIAFAGYPNVGEWFTRFITHLCAPGFFFLMGMSMIFLAENRKKKNWMRPQIIKYFLKRGLVIIGCMFFLEFPGWLVGLSGRNSSGNATAPSMPGTGADGFFFPSTVLYGLGICMVVGGCLYFFKKWQLLIVTMVSFLFSGWYITNANPNSDFNFLQNLIFVPAESADAMVIYPLIPWLGITTFGMFCAKWMQEKPLKIYAYFFKIGLVFIASFFLFRYLEWGNFQRNTYDDFISFFTLIKYPPSVVFALLFCGLNLVLLFLFSKINPRGIAKPIRLFGQTAMFFYLIHLYIYGLIGHFFPTLSLPILYLVWILGLIPLYFICRWYLSFKRGKGEDSFWRML